jgi:hypothetical protein
MITRPTATLAAAKTYAALGAMVSASRVATGGAIAPPMKRTAE